MGYIKTIGLENFRLFKDKTVFDLAPVSILTGINSSGKSSLIKSLQLLRSSIEITGGIDKLSFLKGDHNLGDFSRTINDVSDKKEMKFILDFPIWGITEKTLLELSYLPTDSSGEDGFLSNVRIYIEDGPKIRRILVWRFESACLCSFLV